MDYNQAQQRVKELKRFYKSFLWFVIVTAIIFFDNLFEKGIFNFSLWNGSVILMIWGIILMAKAVKLFILNSEWEKELLEKEMNKTKKPIQF
ncbi:2TM domain-containing protein [Chryseobacterium sp. SSA4.19]|uniref:2TM domain-containing protein n=1 Tax=Chryseobacterium sp. SSA4.19 TaxID=2919915 RepID=UPI001F4E96E0|nr:2TM domain-containing protein [Chryseobacterium sp. SSA4.19]MCJ8152840.1 2TM domain-containing protein [Chryseobacterium sp. SSA4.19]